MNFPTNITTIFTAQSWLGWTLAIVLSVGPALGLRFLLKLGANRLRRSSDLSGHLLPNLVASAFEGTRAWVMAAWIFSLFVAVLDETQKSAHVAHVALAVITCYQFALWGLGMIQCWRGMSLQHPHHEDPSSAGAINLISSIAKGLLLAVILMLGLSNVGVNVSALVASLGVGTLAIGIAAQNILGDLLASISIVLDKPFVVGDFIVVGDQLGTVETIGLKTTRLRALSGEQLIFPNKKLIENNIQNFKRMWQRRVVLKLAVPHATPVQKLEQIPGWIQEFIAADAKLKLDRVHLAGVTGSSIDFEIVFFVLDPDYNLFMDHQQALFFEIFHKLAQENVRLAQPTQRLVTDEPISQIPFRFSKGEAEKTL